MDIKGFKSKDGTVHKYDYNALANVPQSEGTPEQGADGGYYTPEVTQPNDTTMEVSFTPSKADMPTVEPVQVTLPAGSGSGGNADYAGVEPADDDIPKVYFSGTLPMSEAQEDVRLIMHYISKTADFICPVTLKVQGASSTSYPKKNFTLKPYKDETYGSKKKLAFKNWPEMNKFVLKAHWVDHSHVRNVGTAKIWGKIVKSRSDYDSLPEELRNAPNGGATDGFTCKVFCNGVYQGLYEWIVAKDKLFGQDKDIATHSILNSELNNSPTCAFATTSPSMGHWSEELQDSMSSDISTSFANFIKFVAGSTDEEFVTNAENYFDVQSVIDYDILARIFCIVDNLCRNQIFFTYDGVKWYEGVWDADAILGLTPLVSSSWYAYNTEFQTGYVAYKDYGITNMLYQRVENLFLDRFKTRYAELRGGVLSVDNIIDVYERLTDVIKTYDGLLEEDFASTTGGGAFTGIPNKTENSIQQIRNFVAQRIPYMDEQIAAMTAPVACEGITLDNITLTFTAEGTQDITATVTPDGCTDLVVWVSSNPEIVAITVSGYVCTVEAIANGDATITATCGEYSTVCSVSVSGMSEAVACTGISLNATELTFTEAGTKTLTATVTPDGCTDKLTWESNNTNIATVSDGVVAAVGNGSCTITVKCGEHSASCAVSISGIADTTLPSGILTDVSIIDGRCVNGATGIEGASMNSIDFCTSDINVTNYQGKYIGIMYEYDIETAPEPSSSRFVFYDVGNTFISVTTMGSNIFSPSSSNGYLGCTAFVPENAVYMRLSISHVNANEATRTFKIFAEDETKNLYVEDTNIGLYYEPLDGTLKPYDDYNSAMIACSEVTLLKCVNIHHGALFDSKGEYAGRIATNGKNEINRYAMVLPHIKQLGVNRFVSADTYGCYVGKVIGTLTV